MTYPWSRGRTFNQAGYMNDNDQTYRYDDDPPLHSNDRRYPRDLDPRYMYDPDQDFFETDRRRNRKDSRPPTQGALGLTLGCGVAEGPLPDAPAVIFP